MKLNELTQEQRNALCAFGQADQDATVANLIIAGAAAVKPEAAKVLTELADRLYRLPMSDTEYQTLFYTVKYRKEQAMTRLMLDYQCVSGDMKTTRPWKPYAKRLILSAFGNENAMNTVRRLLMAEKVTVDPAIRQTVHELVSDIAVMAVCAPQKYEAYLADSRSIDAAYTMDSDEAVIRQK